MLQECETREDIADVYGIDMETMRLATNRDSSWYMIYEERDDELYIADLAMINGVHSQNRGTQTTDAKLSSFEIAVSTYELMIDMGRKGKIVKTEATRDTSLLNIEAMEAKGLIKVKSKNDFNDGVEKSKIEFEIDVDKMEKELETMAKYLSMARQRARLRSVRKTTDELEEL